MDYSAVESQVLDHEITMEVNTTEAYIRKSKVESVAAWRLIGRIWCLVCFADPSSTPFFLHSRCYNRKAYIYGMVDTTRTRQLGACLWMISMVTFWSQVHLRVVGD